MSGPTQFEEFERVRRGLLRIARESVRQGMAFPGENELARRLGCGRGQIRRVLGSLEHDGIVIRHQGSPTVLDPVALRGTVRLEEQVPLLDMLVRMGYETSVDVMTTEPVPVRADAAQVLRVARGAPAVHRVAVVRADGRPCALVDSTVVLPERGLAAEESTWSSTASAEALAERIWGEPVVRELATLSAHRLSAGQAAMMELPDGTAVVQLDVVGVSRFGHRPYRSLERHHPDLLEYSVYRTTAPF